MKRQKTFYLKIHKEKNKQHMTSPLSAYVGICTYKHIEHNEIPKRCTLQCSMQCMLTVLQSRIPKDC